MLLTRLVSVPGGFLCDSKNSLGLQRSDFLPPKPLRADFPHEPLGRSGDLGLVSNPGFDRA